MIEARKAGREDDLDSHYVREKRKLLGEVPSPFYGARDFGGWYKCGVLPYIDLKLWELTQGESFHWSTFAEHLKRHTGLRYGSEDALAKAARSCMNLLMDKQTLRILRTQAAREQAAQIPKSRKLTLKKAKKIIQKNFRIFQASGYSRLTQILSSPLLDEPFCRTIPILDFSLRRRYNEK